MPDAITHYKVLAPLGVGGLGEVYRARDTNLGRTVAVKVLPSSITGDPALFDALDDTASPIVGLVASEYRDVVRDGPGGKSSLPGVRVRAGTAARVADQRPRAARPQGTRVRHQPRRCSCRCPCCRHDARRHQARHHHDHAEGSRKVHELRVIALYRRWRGTPHGRNSVRRTRRARRRHRRFAQRHLFAGRRDVRDAHRPAARARSGADGPERQRPSGARTDHRPDACGERRAPRTKCCDDRRRVSECCGHPRPPHGSGGGRRGGRAGPPPQAAAHAASLRWSSLCCCWRRRSRRGGCNDRRDTRDSAVPEERLRGCLRDDTRGCRHRSG